MKNLFLLAGCMAFLVGCGESGVDNRAQSLKQEDGGICFIDSNCKSDWCVHEVILLGTTGECCPRDAHYSDCML